VCGLCLIRPLRRVSWLSCASECGACEPRTRGCGKLLAAKDAQIGALTGQLEELRAQVADLAAQVKQKLEELLETAVAGRAGQAGAEVAAEEVRAQAGPARWPAGRDDAAGRTWDSYNSSMDKITSDCPIPVRLAVAWHVGSHTAVGTGF
jgi:hypothetical protein